MTEKLQNKKSSKKLSLKNDIIFKAFFSKKGNEKYLIDFLESILKKEITSVKVKEEVNLEQLSKREKGGRLDLQAFLDDGMIVNIEMQMKDLKNIEQRNDIYEAKTISRYFQRGKDYKDATEVVSIYILDYNLFGFDEYILDTVKVLNNHRDYQVNSITKEYYIQLPRFRKTNPDMNNKLNQWLVVIDGEDRGKIEMAKEKNEIINDAVDEIGYFTESEEAQYLEDMRVLWECDRISEMNYEKGIAREEGLKEGLKEGRKEAEKRRNIEIIKEMRKKDFSTELIIEITKLTKEEIEELEKQEIKKQIN